MQTVSICDGSVNLHCPCCGKRSLSTKGEVKPCKHLMYVSYSETAFDPSYVSDGVPPADDEEEDVVESLEGRFRGSDFLLFRLAEASPAGLEVFVVYRATE